MCIYSAGYTFLFLGKSGDVYPDGAYEGDVVGFDVPAQLRIKPKYVSKQNHFVSFPSLFNRFDASDYKIRVPSRNQRLRKLSDQPSSIRGIHRNLADDTLRKRSLVLWILDSNLLKCQHCLCNTRCLSKERQTALIDERLQNVLAKADE